MGTILLADDDVTVRNMLAQDLRQDLHDVCEVASVEEARRRLAVNHFDVVLVGQRFPDGEGMAVIAAAQEKDPNISAILLTAIADVELAAEGLRHAAFDLITKPFQPGVARTTVHRACERTQLLRDNFALKNRIRRLEGVSEIYGESSVIREERERIAPAGCKTRFEVPTLSNSTSFDLTALLEQTEKELIMRTLSATGGAQAEAARRMGLSRSALAYKLNKYGIRFTA